MTAAIVGVFLVYQLNGHWAWYVGIVGYGLLEAFHHDDRHRAILDQLNTIRYMVHNLDFYAKHGRPHDDE